MRGALAEAGWRGVGRRSHPPPPFLGLVESGTEIKGISLTLGPVIRKLFTDLEDRDSVSREGVMAEGPGECLASQGSPLSPAACLAPGCRHLWSFGASFFPLPAPLSRLDPLCLPSPKDPSFPGPRDCTLLCPPLQSNSPALLSAPLLPSPLLQSPCPLSPLLLFALLLTAAFHTNSPIFLVLPCSPTLAFCHNQMLLSLTQDNVRPAPGDGPCPMASCIPTMPALAAHALLLLSPN